MGKNIFDKCNGLWYKLQSSYCIRCWSAPVEENVIGIWGKRMNNIQDRTMGIVNYELIYA